MQSKHPLRQVIGRTVSQHLGLFCLTVIIIVFAVIVALFPPLILEQIINHLLSGEMIVLTLPITYFLLLAVAGLLESAQNIMITVLGQKMTHGMRSELCGKLKRLPASFFTQNEAGKITSCFVNDVDAVDSLFTNGIISMMANTFKVLSILWIIFYKSRGLGILMLLVIPILFKVTRIFQKRMLKAQLAHRVAISKVHNHVPETIRNIRTIRTLFRQKYMEEKYDDYIGESYHAMEKSNLYDSLYSPIVIFTGSCVVACMMVFSAMGGEMQQFFGITVGTAVAMIAYVSKVFEPLESIGMEIQNIQSAIAGVKRIVAFLQESERNMPIGDLNQNRVVDTAICFDHVDFGYDEQSQVFENLCFSMGMGEAVTLCGRTGIGKSTIFRLILGLYTPQKGRVLVNGIDATDIPDSRKRKLFGYVEQSFYLVTGTIAEQISLFDPSINQQQIEAAAKLVGMHESIMTLRQGYETPIQKATFSQGQLQLLSIARAVVAEPQILLLDEITANLDSETEIRVLDALERACKGRTVLSISHRLQEHTHSHRLIEIGKV